jgi:16S rRNA (guanine527-N7)-methyltransferase
MLPREPISLSEGRPLPPPPGFSASLAALGVALDATQIERMARYLGLLVAMNELVNLTRITAPEEAWTRHVLDALTLVPQLASVPAGARVVDVGSGGGVPGIPLAIARPDLRVSLLEATHKKADFLRAVSAELGLEVEVHAERAEKLASTTLAGTFDVVTARAVAAIDTLLGWTAPFAKPGGTLLFIKGGRADEELLAAKSALKKHRCTHERTVLTPTGRVVVLRVE